MHDVTWLSEEAKSIIVPLLEGPVIVYDRGVDNDGSMRPSLAVFQSTRRRDLRGKR
jgi:hypothetical protein